MSTKFDQIIERKGTDSLKFDFAAKRGMPEDILPLWVADMDFQAPEPVLKAIEERNRHGIYGYTEAGEDYDQALISWFEKRFSWPVEPEWIVKTPGVVFAINMALRALTARGDAVLIQPPVYYPFSESILVNERKLVENVLVYEDGKYRIDFEDFEKKITDNDVKMFILCSPHNPVGRVWKEEELLRLGDICRKHGVYVISDEIHQDFVRPGNRHRVFSTLRPEFEDISVVCTAPSKTFNLAGLQISNIVISNPDIRKKILKEIDAAGYSQVNTLGMVACKAAYSEGEQWLEDLKVYLEGNLGYIREFLEQRLPKVKLVKSEGTYLAWLDFKAFGLTDKELENRIIHDAKLWLDGGTMFGSGGEGFQRVNIACPRATIEAAMSRLEQTFSGL